MPRGFMFRISYNGQRWYAVAAQEGPYFSLDEAEAMADKLNAELKKFRERTGRAFSKNHTVTPVSVNKTNEET